MTKVTLKSELNPVKPLLKVKEETVSFNHPWPFPYSNGKKVVVPKKPVRVAPNKRDYPDALF